MCRRKKCRKKGHPCYDGFCEDCYVESHPNSYSPASKEGRVKMVKRSGRGWDSVTGGRQKTPKNRGA